jgi:hypothetical protein
MRGRCDTCNRLSGNNHVCFSGPEQAPEIVSGIETRIAAYMANRGREASSMAEMEKAVGLDRKQMWAAIRRLESKRLVFRFSIDDESYFSPWRYRKQAYVVSRTKLLSDQWATVYAAFGSFAPKSFLRTPPAYIDDVTGVAYNRYTDDANAGTDHAEVHGENPHIHLSTPPALPVLLGEFGPEASGPSPRVHRQASACEVQVADQGLVREEVPDGGAEVALACHDHPA